MQLPAVDTLIDKMASELRLLIEQKSLTNPAMVGIHTGGAWIAQALHQRLNLTLPLGLLDISFYRDDFTQKGLHPAVKASELPFRTEDQNIILVDDAIHSGRTIRAALNELFDYGRPASVTLAALIDLPGRQLPIQADIIGQRLELAPHQRVKLTKAESMHLEIIQVS